MKRGSCFLSLRIFSVALYAQEVFREREYLHVFKSVDGHGVRPCGK
jgi:hypothetical protein